MEIILASKSPRRLELMNYLPFKFISASKDVEEEISDALSPQENAMILANKKAKAVALDYKEHIVIGCDTLVVAPNKKILGKPRDKEDAAGMLQMLSGNVHEVYSGVSMMWHQKEMINNFYQVTLVRMKDLTQDEIMSYIESKEPFDKAGGYGIQGKGALFIEEIQGDYYNVVGFPLCKIYKEIKKWL